MSLANLGVLSLYVLMTNSPRKKSCMDDNESFDPAQLSTSKDLYENSRNAYLKTLVAFGKRQYLSPRRYDLIKPAYVNY